MKTRVTLVVLLILVAFSAFARLFQIIDPKDLVKDSKLVFVGRVKSVTPSGISTPLTYPPWDGVKFEWLTVKLEVLEPFKGVRKGDAVNSVMLFVDASKGPQPMYSPPGMLGPKKGDIFFLCLATTPLTNVFAALTAPYDEYLSVFALYRTKAVEDPFLVGTQGFLHSDKRFDLIWKLVNESGEIIPKKVEEFGNTYAKEIVSGPAKTVINLEWEKYTNPSGWSSDVPKGYGNSTNTNK
jgi:hypothetical protein